jgi:hypothetical protein
MKRLFTAIAAAGLLGVLAPTAHADVYSMCPDGHEGVVGGHTSCDFAANVRSGFFRFGTHFNAFSPATGQWYEIVCDPNLKGNYIGSTYVGNSVNCYASTNAEVVIW